MTSIGSGVEKSATKSPPPSAASGASSFCASMRTNGSSAATRRGVKTRLTSLRRRSCRGGSMKIIIGVSSRCAGSSFSRINPPTELYVCQSRNAPMTSWKREMAQKSIASLR